MDKNEIDKFVGVRVFVVEHNSHHDWWVNGILQVNSFGQYYVNSFSGDNHFSVQFTKETIHNIDQPKKNSVVVISLQ